MISYIRRENGKILILEDKLAEYLGITLRDLRSHDLKMLIQIACDDENVDVDRVERVRSIT